MAKRELSSTLRNLKFMQRATQREEKPKKEEEVKPDESFFPIRTVNSKCVVVIEGDPHPGAIKGRMSFQSFNPSIDKLNGKGADLHQPETSPTSTTGNGKNSDRENDMSEDDGARSFNPAVANGNDHGHVKRKQTGVGSEAQYPNKSQNSADAYQQSSPNSSRGSTKQKKREKLDWNVLDRRSFKAKKRDHA